MSDAPSDHPTDDTESAHGNRGKGRGLPDPNRLVQEVVFPLRIRFQVSDVLEIIVGACVLAIPVAYTEEVWKLSEQLPAANVAAVLSASVAVVSLFVYYVYYQSRKEKNWGQFFLRVIACYGITLLVVACILAMFQKLPLQSDPSIAIRRMILVGFPACFSATVVDSLR